MESLMLSGSVERSLTNEFYVEETSVLCWQELADKRQCLNNKVCAVLKFEKLTLCERVISNWRREVQELTASELIYVVKYISP